MTDPSDTLSRMQALASSGVRQRRHPGDAEHRLQCACVQWFRMQYRHLSHCLFAVPNGGRRDEATAGKLKAEGQLAGVSDLILLLRTPQYGALLIEMKTPQGRQSETQQQWQQAIEPCGYRYVICRSIDDFMTEVNTYIQQSRQLLIDFQPQ